MIWSHSRSWAIVIYWGMNCHRNSLRARQELGSRILKLWLISTLAFSLNCLSLQYSRIVLRKLIVNIFWLFLFDSWQTGVILALIQISSIHQILGRHIIALSYGFIIIRVHMHPMVIVLSEVIWSSISWALVVGHPIELNVIHSIQIVIGLFL